MSKARSSALNLFLLLIAATSLSSCQYTIGNDSTPSTLGNNDLPVVRADYQHDFINEHVGGETPIIQGYHITAGDGFILDMTDYDMKISSRLRELGITHPNRITIYLKLGHYDSNSTAYYTDLKSNETSFVLASKTLIPMGLDAQPLTGFVSGNQVTVIIGFFDSHGQTTGYELYYPLWGASVYVQ